VIKHQNSSVHLWDVELWIEDLLADCQAFSFLYVTSMASLLSVCSLSGIWTHWQIVCKVAAYNPRLKHTTLSRAPLVEWWAFCRKPLPDNTQHSQEADIHAPGGIETRNLSKRAANGPTHYTMWPLGLAFLAFTRPKVQFGTPSVIQFYSSTVKLNVWKLRTTCTCRACIRSR